MPNDLPLKGKTVILTGTSKTTNILEQIQQLGGNALTFPLIATSEIISVDDAIDIEIARKYDWLIFTSQNAVDTFYAKMQRLGIESWQFTGKIAAVGSKTAEALNHAGFIVSFIPSVFSADVFVKEFPVEAGIEPRCLFVRGSLAKATLRESLPYKIQEWTVYETIEKLDYVKPLIDVISGRDNVTIIFASPSAVHVFAEHIASVIGWDAVQIAAIGHITAAALEKYGATIQIHPKKYTMQAVLAELVKLEEV